MKQNCHKISILDYGMGNIASVCNALSRLSIRSELISSRKEVLSAQAIILPGVGAFGAAVENLKKQDLVKALHESILEKRLPLLGICLGMQLIFSESEESPHAQGLGYIPGVVKKFPESIKAHVPHVGWNIVSPISRDSIFNRLSGDTHFYFDHSYYVSTNSKFKLADTNYGSFSFCSAVRKDHIFGVQFHPEKSQINGLRILKAFGEYSLHHA